MRVYCACIFVYSTQECVLHVSRSDIPSSYPHSFHSPHILVGSVLHRCHIPFTGRSSQFIPCSSSGDPPKCHCIAPRLASPSAFASQTPRFARLLFPLPTPGFAWCAVPAPCFASSASHPGPSGHLPFGRLPSGRGSTGLPASHRIAKASPLVGWLRHNLWCCHCIVFSTELGSFMSCLDGLRPNNSFSIQLCLSCASHMHTSLVQSSSRSSSHPSQVMCVVPLIAPLMCRGHTPFNHSSFLGTVAWGVAPPQSRSDSYIRASLGAGFACIFPDLMESL